MQGVVEIPLVASETRDKRWSDGLVCKLYLLSYVDARGKQLDCTFRGIGYHSLVLMWK